MCTGFWWGNLKERGHLRRARRRWGDNIKIEVHDVGCGGMDWIELGQVGVRWCALLNAVINFLVP
jgi:hypothetical protein